MAEKIARPTVAAAPFRTVNFRVRGVQFADADKLPNGELCLSLEVRTLEVDWSALQTLLEHGGIEGDRAIDYVRKIACKIECEEIAAMLADRLQRLD